MSTVEIHLPPTPSPTLPRVYHVHRAVERVVYKTVGDATRPFVLQTIMMRVIGHLMDNKLSKVESEAKILTRVDKFLEDEKRTH